MKNNPFEVFDADGQSVGWTWYDETGDVDRIYRTSADALAALLAYVAHLEGKPVDVAATGTRP
jgi:hypothetical protein